MDDAFRTEMAAGYTFDEPVVVFGSPIVGDEVLTEVRVQVPLSRVNRHGLIAGATGTGKTKTLQLLAGQLCALGVPVFAVDVKGDLSGVGAPGDPTNPPVVYADRVAQARPSCRRGTPSRCCRCRASRARTSAPVSSFGPLLLGKVLDLNDTQTSILSLVFRYCDDQHLPLLDLADLRTTLKFLGSDDGKPVLEDLGGISPASPRRHPAGHRHDRAGGRRRLLRRARVRPRRPDPDDRRRQGDRDPARGRGRHGPAAPVLDVRALDARPAVRAAARGGRPPEAQARVLLRRGASAVRGRVEAADGADRAHGAAHPVQGRRRLLRDPGADRRPVLGPIQLGNRVQHALRAFTPDDADALRKTARTFP